MPPNKEETEAHATFVVKALFACKRVRLGIQPAVSTHTHVKEPNQCVWNDLFHLLKCINGINEDKLHLLADGSGTLMLPLQCTPTLRATLVVG